MIRNALTVAAVVLTAATAVLFGRSLADPDTVRVPAHNGTPADLPAWARDELVDCRVRSTGS